MSDEQRRQDEVLIGSLRRQGQADRDAIAGLQQRTWDDRDEIAGLHAQAIIDQEIITVLTDQGVIDRDRIGHLQEALVSARRIGAAIGFLMGSAKISDDEALTLLVTASQRGHVKLREVAERVLVTGSVD